MAGMQMPGQIPQSLLMQQQLQQQQVQQQMLQQQQQQMQQQQLQPSTPQQQMMQQHVMAPSGPMGPSVPVPPNPALDQQKLDYISKAKNLMWPLKESLATAMKTAAQNFYQNSMIDIGAQKGTDMTVPRFDKQLEEFYSICDQMELCLRTSIECAAQSGNSMKYVPLPISVTGGRMDGTGHQETLSYSGYVNLTRNQVAYAKDIMDALNDAAQNLSSD